MAKMTLGAYTFQFNPHQFTDPKKKKSFSIVETYSGAAYYSWGTFIAGQRIVLEWDSMPEAMWDELQTLLEADAVVVWNPTVDGAETQYNVEVLKVEGKYYKYTINRTAYRRNVKLTLVITSEV